MYIIIGNWLHTYNCRLLVLMVRVAFLCKISVFLYTHSYIEGLSLFFICFRLKVLGMTSSPRSWIALWWTSGTSVRTKKVSCMLVG